MTTDNIRTQVRELLAYFPGRHRLALLWLIILPVLSFAVSQGIFGKITRVAPGGGVPLYLFYMAGSSFHWVYTLALVVVLLRICHSPRDSWAQSAGIMASSVTYSLVIALPAFLLVVVWDAVCCGTSLSALVQVSVGFVLSTGGLLVLVVLSGFVAHRLGLAIPLLLYLTTAYQYLLPMIYPADTVPEPWRTLLTFGVPLSPTTTILRHGMLNQGFAPTTYWAGAIIHALVGYGLAYWIWKMTPNNTPEPTVANRAQNSV